MGMKLSKSKLCRIVGGGLLSYAVYRFAYSTLSTRKRDAPALRHFSFADQSLADEGFRGRFFVAKDPNGLDVSYLKAMEHLRDGDPGFMASFLRCLADGVNYKAYFFEAPPTTLEKAGAASFQFVLLDAPSLYEASNGVQPDVFADHFTKGKPAVSFASLSGDATLVVPCCPDQGDLGRFAHLAVFARSAFEEDQHTVDHRKHVEDLWKEVGRAVLHRLRSRPDDPIWLSTCGTAVFWLHIRLDDRPKYYTYSPFKNEAFASKL